jgi:anaerobic magnesium-protoporphyrin IX monomethyl ester cyclase
VSMRILLLFPPVGDPTRPYLSMPHTKAALAESGHSDVAQKDCNLEAYLYALSVPSLGRARRRIAGRIAALNAKDRLSPDEAKEYLQVARSALFMPHVCEEIDGALHRLRRPASFADEDCYRSAMRVFERALEGLSAAHHPTQWFSYALRMKHSPERPVEILRAIADEDTNPFLEFFRERTVPEILAGGFRLVRIVVAYQNQLIPALTLARLLKERDPDIHVNLGGVLVSYHGQRLAAWPELGALVDSFTVDSPIPFEADCGGELAFARLATDLERGTASHEISGLTYFDHRAGHFVQERPNRQDRRAAPAQRVDLPAPDFDGLPLDRYLSPALVLPYALSRGCHWGRCAFCFHVGRHAERAVESAVEDLAALSGRYGTRYFYFADDAVSPSLLERLSDRLLAQKLDLRWHCMLRPEASITPDLAAKMAASGCRSAFVGVESGSRRVLDLMNKGARPEEIRRVLRNLHGAGISVRVFCMVGLPTETRAEAQETLDLILSERDAITSVRCQRFRVEKDTPMARAPHKYGIRALRADPQKPFSHELEVEAEGGMAREEVESFYRSFADACSEAFGWWNHQATFFEFSHSSHSLLRSCEELKGAGASSGAPAAPPSGEAAGDVLARVPSISPSVTFGRFPFDLVALQGRESGRAPSVDGGAAVERANERFLYVGESDQVLPVPRGVARILDRCDGRTSVAGIASGFAPGDRLKVVELLRELARRKVIQL